MKKQTKSILSVCLVILLIIGTGSYAYISDYYHADETALAAMAYRITDQVQIEQDGDATWFVPESPAMGLIFYPGGYGPQDGDGISTISGEEQIRQTAEAIAAFAVR